MWSVQSKLVAVRLSVRCQEFTNGDNGSEADATRDRFVPKILAACAPSTLQLLGLPAGSLFLS